MTSFGNCAIHRCISLVITLFSYPESVSQEVDRERRLTPDTERKLQGTTTNLQGTTITLQVAYYVYPCQYSFQLSQSIWSRAPINHPKTTQIIYLALVRLKQIIVRLGDSDFLGMLFLLNILPRPFGCDGLLLL